MKVEQISTLLNETLVPNYLGTENTIAADLSNIVDLGTAIADVDAATIKDFAGAFVVGVARNWFDTRQYERVDYGLMSDAREYGGVVQRVKARLLEVEDSPIWTLQNGTDYFDGKYYGIDVDNRIYSKDTIFQIKNSIPTEMWKQSFMSADGVRELIALIEQTVDNTLATNLNALAKSIYQQIITSANENNSINLLSLYNADTGSTLTATDALYNASFLRYSARVIARLRSYITDMSKKYNDGTIETFTPSDDVRVTLLNEFSTAIDFNMEADTFHNEMVSTGKYNTINFWQNASDDLLPTLGTTAQVKVVNNDETTTIDSVVAVIHDKYTGGFTARLDKVTAQYIANGDFTTYFHHIAQSRFVDTRNNAIVLKLA